MEARMVLLWGHFLSMKIILGGSSVGVEVAKFNHILFDLTEKRIQ